MQRKTHKISDRLRARTHPASIAGLDAGLADVDGDALTHWLGLVGLMVCVGRGIGKWSRFTFFHFPGAVSKFAPEAHQTGPDFEDMCFV